MTSTIGVLSEMHENLTHHKTEKAREIYLRRVCRDLDIRDTVMKYEQSADPDFHAKQLGPQLKRPEKDPPARRPDLTRPIRPGLIRRRSAARLELDEKHDDERYKRDFNKETMKVLYRRQDEEVTTVPFLVEDWTLWPPPGNKNTQEKEWQTQFRKQAQPLIKLSALLSMPLEQSEIIFAHYGVDEEFKKPLALFAGAAAMIPYNGAGVPEPGPMAMIMKALADLARAGTQKGRKTKVVKTPWEEEKKEETKVLIKKHCVCTWLSNWFSHWFSMAKAKTVVGDFCLGATKWFLRVIKWLFE